MITVAEEGQWLIKAEDTPNKVGIYLVEVTDGDWWLFTISGCCGHAIKLVEDTSAARCPNCGIGYSNGGWAASRTTIYPDMTPHIKQAWFRQWTGISDMEVSITW